MMFKLQLLIAGTNLILTTVKIAHHSMLKDRHLITIQNIFIRNN